MSRVGDVGVSFDAEEIMKQPEWQDVVAAREKEKRMLTDQDVMEQARACFDKYAAMDSPELPAGLWSRMQVEMFRWQTRNFGGAERFEIMAGITEEVGELAHVLLKNKQGIRGYDDPVKYRTEASDAIGDAVMYMVQLCTILRLDFGTIVMRTAEKVQQRDWRADAEAGGEV